MISTNNDYETTYSVVRDILDTHKPVTRGGEKTLLFMFRYGAGWHHGAVETALRDYQEARERDDAG